MYQFTAEQKVELKALSTIADARPVSQLGAWKEVYEKLYEFITEQEYVPPVDGVGGGFKDVPIDGVDHNVWLWVGANTKLHLL